MEARPQNRGLPNYACFEPGRPGEPGQIVLSQDLKTEDPAFVDRVVLEELGEALADHLVTDRGVVPGEGDVGNRLMKVFLGEPFAEGDFEAKNSDKVWVRRNQHNASQEEGHDVAALATEWGVTVERATEVTAELDVTMYGPPFTAGSYPVVVGWTDVIDVYGVNTPGQLTLYELGAAMADGMVTTELAPPGLGDEGARIVNYADHVGLVGDTPPAETEPPEETEPVEEDVAGPETDAELAAAWGIEDPAVVTNARDVAHEIYERNGFTGDQGFTLGDHDSAGWDQMIKIYGLDAETDTADPVLQVDELARAIAEDTFTTTVNSAGETVFDSVNLMGASDIALTDAIWVHAERNSQDGTGRVQINLDLLQDAVAYVTGDPEGFVTDADRQIIQTHYADVFFGDETRENGEPGASRFSKDAILNIWETTGFIRRAAVEPDILEFSVSTEYAQAVTPAEPAEPTDPDDPGLIGDGNSAYGVPLNAVNEQTSFVHAEDNPLGRDVYVSHYSLPEDSDTTYIAAMLGEDQDYLVISGTVMEDGGETVTFDSSGIEQDRRPTSDLDNLTAVAGVRSGDAVAQELVTWAESNEHTVLHTVSSSTLSYVVYEDGATGDIDLRYVVLNDDGSEDAPVTVAFGSDEADAVMDAGEVAESVDVSRNDHELEEDEVPTRRVLSAQDDGTDLVVLGGAVVFGLIAAAITRGGGNADANDFKKTRADAEVNEAKGGGLGGAGMAGFAPGDDMVRLSFNGDPVPVTHNPPAAAGSQPPPNPPGGGANAPDSYYISMTEVLHAQMNQYAEMTGRTMAELGRFRHALGAARAYAVETQDLWNQGPVDDAIRQRGIEIYNDLGNRRAALEAEHVNFELFATNHPNFADNMNGWIEHNVEQQAITGGLTNQMARVFGSITEVFNANDWVAGMLEQVNNFPQPEEPEVNLGDPDADPFELWGDQDLLERGENALEVADSFVANFLGMQSQEEFVESLHHLAEAANVVRSNINY